MDWDVRLLGELSAARGVEEVTRFRTQKTAALFAFLAFRAGTPQPRELLIERFWPESELEQARMSLRTALASLRKTFGDSLASDSVLVMLHARTDLARYESALRAARSDALADDERLGKLSEAVELYGGPLLPMLYDDWVLTERDRLEREQLAALSALARWHERRGDLAQALDYAQRAAAIDLGSEPLRYELIRLLKQTGRAPEALRQFQELEKTLLEKLGTRPAPPTLALVAELLPGAEKPSRGNLRPRPAGRFRGRHDELAALDRLLREPQPEERLVTLFGPGGIGKTRLALEAGQRFEAETGEPAYFVPLAATTNAEQVWETVLAAVGVPLATGLSPLVQLAAALRNQPCLLILDNAEHVARDTAEICAALLAELPKVLLLVTSRQRLGFSGEALVPVGALSPGEGAALFADRAQSATARRSSSAGERDALERLVARLDGMPLALELAAAWSAVLTPEEMLAELERDVLSLPARPEREARQSSLPSLIGWSVRLLSPDLRRAFLALSVFRGGWRAEAAEDVCGVGRDALASLRDRSLIQAQSEDGRLRFSFHEAIREYAARTLPSEEREELSRRYTAYFLRLAQNEQTPTNLAREHENFRKALEEADAPVRRELCRALGPFWDEQGHWQEGRRWLEVALAEESLPGEVRWELLDRLARLCHNLFDEAASRKYHEEALLLAQARGDERGIGRALLGLASVLTHEEADYAGSREKTLAAREFFQRARDRAGEFRCLIGLGTLATLQGDLALAWDCQTQALNLAREHDLVAEAATAHHRLGITALSDENLDACREHLQAAEKGMTERNNKNGLATVRNELGSLAHREGDNAHARALFHEARETFQELGELWAVAVCQGNLARLALAEGNLPEAAAEWRDGLALRELLKDPYLLVSGLDGATAVLLARWSQTPDPDLAADIERCVRASLAWRAERGAGAPNLDGWDDALTALRESSPTLSGEPETVAAAVALVRMRLESLMGVDYATAGRRNHLVSDRIAR